MHVTIVEPRLDLSFKDPGPGFVVPDKIGEFTHPIREHWHKFTLKLAAVHTAMDDKVVVNTIPGWEITMAAMSVLSATTDILYLPHRQRFEFPIPNARFYMQTVFPEYFTIDDNGWGAYLSYLPINVDDVQPNEVLWQKLQKRITNNESKFDQPNSSILFKHNLNSMAGNFLLFVCQIPHDQVIIQSSAVSVATALRETINYARYNGYKVVVKGHPVNPGAMSELKAITFDNKDIATWVDTGLSIHTLLSHCKAAFMVNSGVGFEAMLHGKPIVTFGNSEYKEYVNQWSGFSTPLNMDYDKYKRFMTAFFNKLFYTGET
jgi:hypothetical protein